MNKIVIKSIKLSLVIIAIVLSVGWLFILHAHAQPNDTAAEYPIIGGETVTLGMGLARYIRYIYTFALGIVGIAALAVIIFGGIRYMSSAGNPGAQKDAKDWITGAILGLLLLLSSYLILYTINPDLVTLDPSLPALWTIHPEYYGINEVKIGAVPSLKWCMDQAKQAGSDNVFKACAQALGYSMRCDKVDTTPTCAATCLAAGLSGAHLECLKYCPEINPSSLPPKSISATCQACLVGEGYIINPAVNSDQDVDNDSTLQLDKFDLCRCNPAFGVSSSVCWNWAEDCGDGTPPGINPLTGEPGCVAF